MPCGTARLMFCSRPSVHSGRDAYLYVLIEHQSTPDRLMALRMLGYQLRIWERHLARPEQRSRTRPLPLIIPVVIYQGRRQWIAPTDLRSDRRRPGPGRRGI